MKYLKLYEEKRAERLPYRSAFLLNKISNNFQDWRFYQNADELIVISPTGDELKFSFDDYVSQEYEGSGDWKIVIRFEEEEDGFIYSITAIASGRGYREDEVGWEDVDDLIEFNREKIK